MEKLSNRLTYALQIRGKSQVDLAKAIGIKPQAIQSLCAGKAKSSTHIVAMAQYLNVDLEWLDEGRGNAPEIDLQMLSRQKTLAKRLVYAIKLSGKSQTAIAQEVKIPLKQIRNLSSGINKSSSYIPQLSRVLNISAEWLQSGNGPLRLATAKLAPAGGRYPQIPWSSIPVCFNSVEHQENNREEWVYSFTTLGEKSFALTVEGKSMESSASGPSFVEGYTILIDPNVTPKDGSFIIASDGNTPPILRQLILEGGRKYLACLNVNYPNRMIDVTDSLTVYGVVKELSQAL